MKHARRSGLGKCSLALATLLATWGAAEAVAWLSGRGGDDVAPPAGSDEALYAVEQDPVYGYQLGADHEHTAVKPKPEGGTCYRTVYRTDSFRRRIVGTSARPGRPHLLLFGCSVTMGEGLADDATLQYRLAEELPDVEVFDYAVHGWGPTHALAKLRSGELPRQVPSHRGSAVYFLIPAHISRVVGDTRTYWLFDSPSYDLAADGSVTGGASFRAAHPWRTALYEGLLAARRHSWLLPALHVELPLWHSDADLELTAAVLAAARQNYREQFDGEFFVAFHPTWELASADNRRTHDRLRSLLAARGVPVLDYAAETQLPSDVIDPTCDWHPGPALNQALAARLAGDLLRDAPDATLPPPGTLVLVYHRIGSDPAIRNAETVPVADFEAQMQELVRRGYRSVSLAEMLGQMRGDPVSAGKTVLVTLDDGWKSQSLALPILRRLGIKASFAIFPGKGLGQDYFEWPDVEAISADPLFEVFSHSMTHPWDNKENIVTWVDGASVTHGAADADNELFESKRVLEEHLKEPVEFFAWPRGWYNARLVERAVAAGYKGLLTIDPGTNAAGDDPRYIKRVMVDGQCSLDQFRDILDHHRYPLCSAEDGPMEHRPSPYVGGAAG